MAKDPACLFYWGDWAGGTATFSRHLKGCYMDLLNAQFNNGPLSLDEIKTVLGTDFSCWNTLQKKFVKSDSGLFFNKRLQEEKDKRANYSASRKKNAEHMKEHMPKHMDNGNENRIRIENEKKGVQGDFDEKFKTAFDEIYLEGLKMSRAYPGVDIDQELARFFLKVKGSPRVYADHGTDGLRLAFNAQLRSARPVNGEGKKPQRQKAFNLDEI